MYTHTYIRSYVHRHTSRTPAPTGAPALAQKPLQRLHVQRRGHTTRGHTEPRKAAAVTFGHKHNPVPSCKRASATVPPDEHLKPSLTHMYSFKDHTLTQMMLPTPWPEHRHTSQVGVHPCTAPTETYSQCLSTHLERTHPNPVQHLQQRLAITNTKSPNGGRLTHLTPTVSQYTLQLDTQTHTLSLSLGDQIPSAEAGATRGAPNAFSP